MREGSRCGLPAPQATAASVTAGPSFRGGPKGRARNRGICCDLTLYIHCCSGEPDEIVAAHLIAFQLTENPRFLRTHRSQVSHCEERSGAAIPARDCSPPEHVGGRRESNMGSTWRGPPLGSSHCRGPMAAFPRRVPEGRSLHARGSSLNRRRTGQLPASGRPRRLCCVP